MAIGVTWNTIYLGNFAEMDTNESTADIETATPITGTHGSPGSPLYKQTVDVSTNSTDGDDQASTNNFSGSDTLTYDVGGGSQTTQMDAIGFFNGSVTFTNGSTVSDSFVLMQDDAGNTFLLPMASGGTDLTAEAIESISITSAGNTNYSGANQSTFSSQQFVCFAPGTLILCPEGERRVEDLRQGDCVVTADRGPQHLIWTGARQVDLSGNPDQAPVELKPGALGPGAPSGRLVVSPQHRVLLRGIGSKNAVDEILTPVKALADLPRIRRMSGKRTIIYHTLLCRRHEILFANGLAVESLYPGPVAMRLFTPRQRGQIIARVPALLANPRNGFGAHARPVLGASAFRRRMHAAQSRPTGIASPKPVASAAS